MELERVCKELEDVFPVKFARKYEPLSFIFPAVNLEARINYKKLYERKFLESYNGLMVRGSKNVERVFCIVFPSDRVLREIINRCRTGDFIFTHHCCGYDETQGFVAVPQELVEELQVKQVSLYSLHTPFDVNSPWSTSVQLARAVGIKPEGEFAVVMDKPSGVFGKSPADGLNSLAAVVSEETGAGQVTIIANRSDLSVGKIAVVAGGGGYANLVNDAHRYECDTYLTGTAVETVEVEAAKDANMRFREKAAELGINIIGAGHYHTEKVAVEKMTGFFRGLNLFSEFIPEGIGSANE